MDFKIKKTIRIISGIFLIIASWLSLGIGFAIKCTHFCTTVIFISGLFPVITGILVLGTKNKQ